MRETVLTFGHGYEVSDRGRCTAFDNFDILAEPLGGFSNADRERRSFHPEGSNYGVTYGSHAVRLGRERREFGRGDLAVMMHHGGGREVLSIRDGIYGVPLAATLQALPENELYALLYSINEAAMAAYRQGKAEADAKWRTALEEGRVKKRRPKRGIRRGGWDILSDWEMPDSWRRAKQEEQAKAA